jgi:hypothetical protein
VTISILRVHDGRAGSTGTLKALHKTVTRWGGTSGMANWNELQMGCPLGVDREPLAGIADATSAVLTFLLFSPTAEYFVRADDAFERLGSRYDSLEFVPARSSV